MCREFGHRAQSCPLSGLCRRCRQPGHKAKECTQAWDSAPASSDHGSTCTVVPTDSVKDFVPIAVDEVPDPEPPDVQIERVPDPELSKVQTVSTYVDIPVLIPFPSTSPPVEAPAKAPAKASAKAVAKILSLRDSDKKDVNQFTEEGNKFHPTIKFTAEISERERSVQKIKGLSLTYSPKIRLYQKWRTATREKPGP